MHTQILHFVGGIKRTIPNIVRVYENEMCHILQVNGVEWIINKNNLLAVEKLPEEMSESWEKSAPKRKIG